MKRNVTGMRRLGGDDAKYHVVRLLALASLGLAMTGRASGQCLQWDSSVQLPSSYYGTHVLAAFDDGSGPVLHTNLGGRVMKWTGTAWGGVANDYFANDTYDAGVYALSGYDDGSGTALYAGGSFTHLNPSGLPIRFIGKLVGSTWQVVGNGLPATGPGTSGSGGWVSAMAAFDDGGGKQLYIGGNFNSYSPFQSDSFLRWDGTTWSEVGGGLAGASGGNPWVRAMCEYDDGSGLALYVAGLFTSAGGFPANNIAKWDGSSWSALGSGIMGDYPYAVLALAVYDDGSGPALYVGGDFHTAGGVQVDGLAKWNGTSWSAIPGATTSPPTNQVYALGVHDDGTGRALYASVATPFPDVGGPKRWNGSNWSVLGGGAGGIRSLMSFDDGQGGGPALFIAGSFGYVGGSLLCRNVSRWLDCTHRIDSMCAGDGSFAHCPCQNGLSPRHGCRNSASPRGALLSHSGTASPDTLTLISSNEPILYSLSMFLQSDSPLPYQRLFGDGILCLGGQIRRMYLNVAVGGTAQAPAPGDPSITQRSAALGDPLAPGSVRYYQVWYRDPVQGFCTTAEFNISNGLRVVW